MQPISGELHGPLVRLAPEAAVFTLAREPALTVLLGYQPPELRCALHLQLAKKPCGEGKTEIEADDERWVGLCQLDQPFCRLLPRAAIGQCDLTVMPAGGVDVTALSGGIDAA